MTLFPPVSSTYRCPIRPYELANRLDLRSRLPYLKNRYAMQGSIRLPTIANHGNGTVTYEMASWQGQGRPIETTPGIERLLAESRDL